MTQFLPPILLTLFYPREPIPFLPQIKKKTPKCYDGISKYLNLFEDPVNTPPPYVLLTREEIREAKRNDKVERAKHELEEKLKLWDPRSDPNVKGDPLKSLFIGKLSYETTESKLTKDFESYGPLKKVEVVADIHTGKSRGYAFIEFEHEHDMKTAYKRADGKKIDGKRILVDVERGRTVKSWLPRRLGGGLGGEKRIDMRKKIESDEAREPLLESSEKSESTQDRREKRRRSRSRGEKPEHHSSSSRRKSEKSRSDIDRKKEHRELDETRERPPKSSHRDKGRSRGEERRKRPRSPYPPEEETNGDGHRDEYSADALLNRPSKMMKRSSNNHQYSPNEDYQNSLKPDIQERSRHISSSSSSTHRNNTNW